ncbi:MAG: hypothetical protein OIF36_00370 [Alphaproteobacteria bacterium]|nr:hypothetical protein [Alphaproteobacteria bacterium]
MPNRDGTGPRGCFRGNNFGKRGNCLLNSSNKEAILEKINAHQARIKLLQNRLDELDKQVS